MARRPTAVNTAYGKKIGFKLLLKQRDADSGATFDVWGFGYGLHSPWMSRVEAPGFDTYGGATVYLPGGSSVLFSSELDRHRSLNTTEGYLG